MVLHNSNSSGVDGGIEDGGGGGISTSSATTTTTTTTSGGGGGGGRSRGRMKRPIITTTTASSFAIGSIYFFQMAGVAAMGSFVPLYLSEKKGLSLVEVGIYGVIRPALKFMASPMWTTLADAHGAQRTLYTASALGACVVNLFYMVADTLPAIFAVLLVATVVESGWGPMLDAGVLASMDDPQQWGRHRLWGAVGYGISIAVIGMAVRYTGWSVMFAVHLGCTLMAVLLVRRHLPLGNDDSRPSAAQTKKSEAAESACAIEAQQRQRRHPKVSGERSSSGGSGGLTLKRIIGIVAGTRERAIFFSVVLLCGICTGVIENFLFIFLKNDLHADRALVGLSRTVTCGAEVPAFLAAAYLLRRMGTLGVLAITCVAYIVRLLAYAILHDPVYVLLIEPLHGITYALMWNASAAYAHQISPPGMNSTAQGILAGVHWGLGLGLGALFGGLVYEAYGARVMFRSSAMAPIISLVLLALHVLFKNPGGGGGGGGGGSSGGDGGKNMTKVGGGGGEATVPLKAKRSRVPTEAGEAP